MHYFCEIANPNLPARFPHRQQVSEAIERCSQLLDYMYAAAPEDRDPADSEGEVISADRGHCEVHVLSTESL